MQHIRSDNDKRSGPTWRNGVAWLTSGLVMAAGLAGIAAPAAQAATGTTYTVDRVSLCRNAYTPAGGMTFEEALAAANRNPGKDTIEFQPGLGGVSLSTCYGKVPGLPYGTQATESVHIIGNRSKGVTIEGNQLWFDRSGRANDPNQCPQKSAGSVWVQLSPGFMEVGTLGADNTGVEVSVSDMAFHNMNSLFKVEKNAALTMTDSHASDINAFLDGCDRAAIEVDVDGGDVTLTRVMMDHNSVPGARTGETDFNGLIQGGFGGNLVIDESYFYLNSGGRAVSWLGSSATIVSTRFIESGGLYLDLRSGGQIVNSAFYNAIFDTLPSDRIYAKEGTVDVKASTFYWMDPNCSKCSLIPGMGFVTSGSGRFNFETSAIGAASAIFGGGPLIYDDPTAFSSDALTWVQPTPQQSAAALRTILPNVKTDAPGLMTDATPATLSSTALTPLLGTPSAPGVLIDAVPDADPGQVNELRNPIDGSPIRLDVLGSPRVAANGTRTIGAVQLSYSPHLAVVDPTTTSLTATWTKPLDPPSGPITGYRLSYRVKGSGAPYTTVAVAGADTLQQKVEGLTPDTEYELYVVAVNAAGDGPRSNVASGITLPDAHLDYSDGAGVVGKKIDRLEPHTHDVSEPRNFAVYDGELPPGLVLNKATGVISGTPTKSGTYTVKVVVVGSNGATARTTVKITITGDQPSPALAYPDGRGEQGTPIQPLDPHVSGLPGPWKFAVVDGRLPDGLRLDPRTGEITGTPKEHGRFTAKIKVVGDQGAATTTLVLDIRPSASPYLYYRAIRGTVGKPITKARPHPGGLTGTVTYRVARGSLPRGLTLNSRTGVITGKPRVAGRAKPTVTATGSNGSAKSPVRIRVTGALRVSALPQDKRLPVDAATKVVRKATGEGAITVRAWCAVDGVRTARNCDTELGRKHAVTVTPQCNDRVTYTVRVTEKTGGKTVSRWSRTWKVDPSPKVRCTAHGTG